MKPPYQPSLILQACGCLVIVLLTAWLCFIASPAFAQTAAMQQPTTEQDYHPRPYQGQLEADDGQWIRPAKDYASTRYSSLDQINAKNAKDLKLAFTFSTGMTHGHEAAPSCREQYDVHRHPLSEQSVRSRPYQARRSDEVGV